jgi:hypothetical protein
METRPSHQVRAQDPQAVIGVLRAQNHDGRPGIPLPPPSPAGRPIVRQIAAKDRYARTLAAVTEWCRLNLHRPFREQHAHLSRVIRGHCAYYGITGNSRRLD